MKQLRLLGILAVAAGLLAGLSPTAKAEVRNPQLVPVDKGGLLPGYNTFDLKVETTLDWTQAQVLVTLTTGTFYQDPVGTSLTPNPLFFTLAPTLAYDTFVTGPTGYPNTGAQGTTNEAGAAVNLQPGVRDPVFDEKTLDYAWFDVALGSVGTWTIARITISEDAVGELHYMVLDAGSVESDPDSYIIGTFQLGGAPPENLSKLLIPTGLAPEVRDEATGQSLKTYNLPWAVAPGAVVRGSFAAGIENIHTVDTATYTATTTGGASSDLEPGGTLGPGQSVAGTLTLDLIAPAEGIAESLTIHNTVNGADQDDVIRVLGAVDAGSAIIGLIGDGQPYAGVKSTSDKGGGNVMQLVGGANDHSQPESIAAVWSPRPGDSPVISDVVDLTGIEGDVFALQMSYDPALLVGRGLPPYLAIFDGYWRHIGDLNKDGTPDTPGVEGPFDGNLTVGHWGYDMLNNVVWGVTDHNSEFAVVPEPGSLLLLLGAALGLAMAWRRRG